MIKISELSTLLGLSSERVKQLCLEKLETNPNFGVDTGPLWKVAPSAARELIEERGKHFKENFAVTFASLKGGIGKTTLSVNVACRASSLGAKVLLIDIDPEACATNQLLKNISPEAKAKLPILKDVFKENLGLKEAIVKSDYPFLDLIPSSLKNSMCEKIVASSNPKRLIRDRLEQIKSEGYNLILLELPPSYSTLVGSAYLAADLIIMPCTPSIYSLESVALTIEAVDNLAAEFECPAKNYKILMNQYSPGRVASQEVLDALIDSYKSTVLPIKIRDSADIANATNAGKSVFEVTCSKTVRQDFQDLTQWICGLQE
jgi:chromosome partitioning protein